jgi:hypothetical protein
MAKADLVNDNAMGALEAIREGVQAIAPGLSLSNILHDVGKELKEQAVMGSHELASALFRGDAFVMYPRTSEGQGTDHGLPEMQQEQERGGREM